MLQGLPGLRQMDRRRVVRKSGRDPWGEGPLGGGCPVCRLWLSQKGGSSGFLSLEFVSVVTDVGAHSSWYLVTPSPASVTGKM